jgi:diguanylate cyclase (GGDEF)-like protein
MELSLLMLDVDLFKQFNDLYGHLAGDDCLKRVAETLKTTIQRESDLVARYGGEEFVVLLPSTNPEGAARVAENLLSAIRDLRIEHAGSPHRVLTVSIGLASCCNRTAPIDRSRLLEQVDAALYAAKRAGRNRLCFANPD